MSTEYVVLKHGDGSVILDETSNLFELSLERCYGITGAETIDVMSLENLTAAQLIGLAIELLKVASYATTEDTFEQAVVEFLHSKPDRGYYAEILNRMWWHGANDRNRGR